jgi:hypothetical protein
MKRLVDETTDELARSLLQAGIEHHPPPGNKAQVIVALGAGGALGMMSSNAFAWLSTTAGKVTAVGVAVGVAGAVWVAVPPAGDARSNRAAASSEASKSEDIAPLRAGAPNDGAHSQPVVDGAGTNGERTASIDRASIDRASIDRAAAPEAEASALAKVDTASDDTAGTAVASEGQARSSRRERGARKLVRKSPAKENGVASKQSELRRDGPLSAVATPPAGGAIEGPSAEQDALDTEVRLVDEMHSAARRNDREALARVVDRYRASFPDGQLKREVAEFASRFERPDAR